MKKGNNLTNSEGIKFVEGKSFKGKDAPVRKSASLIILQDGTGNNNNEGFKILFIKRMTKMSFSDMYAFPGGALDKEDIEYQKNSQTQQLLTCAVRETFEETGLLFYDKDKFKNQENLSQKMGKLQEFYQKNNKDLRDFWPTQNQEQFSELKIQEKDINSFMRLVTIQQMPYRFDTQFYISFADKFVNWQGFNKSEQSLFDYQNLKCQENEVSEYQWMTPVECLSKYTKKQLNLAFPQFIILNVLSNFKNVNQVQQFLSNRNINPQTPFEKDPFQFPVQFVFQENKTSEEEFKNYQAEVLFPTDYTYPFEQIIDGEKDSMKEEYVKLSQNYKEQYSKTQDISRLYISENIMSIQQLLYRTNIKSSIFSPYNFILDSNQLREKINNYEKQQTQPKL